jgi:hypothetical protein
LESQQPKHQPKPKASDWKWWYLFAPVLIAFFIAMHFWSHVNQEKTDALPMLDQLLVWGINAIAVLTGFVTMRRLLRGKRVGYIGIIFVCFLLLGYVCILRYGEILDLLG